MGELARQRRARDLWISRSHLWALGFGVIAATSVSFFVGLSLARSGPSSTATPVSASAMASDESLVELLARVDSNAEANSGVNALSFPDALTGVTEGSSLPVLAPDEAPVSAVAPGVVGDRPTDLALAIETASEAGLLADALVGRGWSVRVQTEGAEISAGSAMLIITGGDTVENAKKAREELLISLAELERSTPVVLIPR